MGLRMTLTANRTRSYRGLVFGGPGSDYRILSEEGLEGFEVRVGDRELPREDGSIPGLHLVSSREFMIVVRVEGVDDEDLETKLAALEVATVPSRSTEHRYVFLEAGRAERFIRARVTRRSRPRDAELVGAHTAEVSIMFRAADPRIYSSALKSINVPVFEASGGGFDLPADLPINMTAPSQALGNATNDGARDAYPLLRFQYVSGTVTGVLLTNLTNGDVLDIDTTLTAGQTLVADMGALIRATGDPVVYIGSASRYGDWQLPRDPFRLSSGSNLLKLEVSGGGSVVGNVSWRDTD